jgi:hypothetical protein
MSAPSVETPAKPPAKMPRVAEVVIKGARLTAEAAASLPIMAARVAATVAGGAVATLAVGTMITGMALLQCVVLLFSGEITDFWKDSAAIMGEGIIELGRLLLHALRPPFR